MTIKDIARQSGYAISTVSRVLNNHEDVSETARMRILAVVEENNFRLNNNAKHLKQQKSANIAIVVKGTMNELFAILVEGMQEQIKQRGYTAVVYYVDEEQNEVCAAMHFIRECKAVGLIFLGGLSDHFANHFSTISLPSIMVTMRGDGFGFGNLSSISVDDSHAAAHAVSQLFDLGHRHVGVISGNTAISGPAGWRLQGCHSAFSAHGLSFNTTHQVETARYSFRGGYVAMQKLLQRMPELTAVFCMSDMMAIGAMRALADHGKRVPQDISVVGFDGLPACEFSVPRLTTIRQDTQLFAQHSVEILQQMMQNMQNAQIESPTAQHVLLPYTWIAGESIAPPNPSP